MLAPERPSRLEDAFYVGYLPAPPVVVRRMRRLVVVLVSAAGLAAAVLGASTGPFSPSLFEFATEREYQGAIETSPYPILLVRGDGRASPLGEIERIPLVAPGKHGADPLVAGSGAAPVHLRGKRIFREGRTMVEIVPGSIAPASPAETARTAGGPASRVEDLGSATLVGEIVDSKCFLGVMNPGQLEVHRACAIRCISGGIPPMLFVRDALGRVAHLLLVSSSGEKVNRDVLDLVARPVRITGRLERRDDLFYLYADPGTYERVR